MKKDLRLLKKYIKNHKLIMILSLVFALIYVLSASTCPVLFGKSIDEITRALNDSTIGIFDTNFIRYIGFAVILIILSVIFQFLFEIFINILTEKITKEIRNDLIIKFNKIPVSYIDSHSHGDLVSRVINDVDNVNVALVSSFRQLYQGIIQIIFTLTIMMILNWILGLVVIVLTPICFLISYTVAKNSSKYFKKQAIIVGEMGGNVLENFDSLSVIQSFNYQEKAFEKYQKMNDELYKVGQKAQYISTHTNPSTRLINNTVYAIVGMVAAILCAVSYNNGYVFLGATCSIGTILVFIQFANQFAKPLNEISSCVTEIQTGFTSLTRINEVFNAEDDLDEGQIEQLGEISSIDFNDISFSYNKDKKLIENFNANIKKGSKIAIVGPTGSGKTTLINLLLRFYDTDKGDIEFNGNPSKDIKKSVLRDNFIMVLQDTRIFKGSIYENIAYSADNCTYENVVNAAKLANCYGFISKLENGFDTIIDENSGLSAGQKQLICIARAFINLREIVILDEATSNVDTRTEEKISDAFNKLIAGRTAFVIAHRLSTIESSNLILVINNGSIVETGTHKELLKKKGFYYELYNAQYAE